MDYNFTEFKCTKGTAIGVDDSAKYGYFERQDGSEGGGLWFDVSINGSKRLELVDYDGMSSLPMRVILTLREQGYYVPVDME